MLVSMTRIEAILKQGTLRTATRMVIGEIAWARGKAASTHHDLILALNEVDNSITCCEGEDEREGLQSNPVGGSGDGRRKLRLPDGVAFRDIVVPPGMRNQEGEVRVRFYANGTVDPLVIYLGNDRNETFRMGVNPLTGEVRLHDQPVD
jgi:hypothetical protein